MNRVTEMEGKRSFPCRDIIECTVSNIYGMYPRYAPPNMWDIVKGLRDAMIPESFPKPHFPYQRGTNLFMTDDEFHTWLKDTLMSIKRFRELNLTYRELMMGVDVDDPNRTEVYTFHSMYDEETENSWNDDFIDLDACIGNIYGSILKRQEPIDCMLCDLTGTESCKTCTLNPQYTNRYEHRNTPFGDNHAEWCTVACPNHIAVCCQDCPRTENCDYICPHIKEGKQKEDCEMLVVREEE